MSLSGLLQVVTDDPDLRHALDQAAELPALGGDLIAPASLRPLLVAALAGAGTAPGRRPPVTLAVTATAREAEELAAAARVAARAGLRRLLPGLGDAAA